MPAVTPERRALGAIAITLQGYFGGSVEVSIKEEKNSHLLVFRGIPLFSKKDADVIFKIPKGWLKVTKEGISTKITLASENVRFLLSDGSEFEHPHVWEGGAPCWNHNRITTIPGALKTVKETLLWENVTPTSQMEGHFTRCPCTDKLLNGDTWKLIEKHKERIRQKVECSDQDFLAYFAKNFPPIAQVALAGI